MSTTASLRPGPTILLLTLSLAGVGPAVGCAPDTGPAGELLGLQRLEREAHLSYDVSRLAPHLADTVVTVADGLRLPRRTVFLQADAVFLYRLGEVRSAG